MEEKGLMTIENTLKDAQHLLQNEIQCVVDEDVWDEYQTTINKIDVALQVIKEYKG